jgi:chemotaxis protein MotA
VDIATLLGIACALFGVIGGLLWDGGRLAELIQPSAALIVVGGTLGAVLVSFPLQAVTSAVVSIFRLFSLSGSGRTSPEAVIDEVLAYANRARRQGLLSLERPLQNASDPLLRQGLALVVDGQDPTVVRNVLDLKIQCFEERLERTPRVLEAAGGYAPTIGILGAVIGLIHVMQRLDGLDGVGAGIATAFVATLYGVGFANLFLLPLASKVRALHREQIVCKEMIVEGVLSIQERLAPRLIEDKLRSFRELEDAAA